MKKPIELTPEQYRSLQLKQLDALILFDRICRENGLRYYLMYGTLLGAVRHKGFIPWDDDSDILMPRSDYEKFLKQGQQWLGDAYFLQNQTTDPETYTCITKLRINNTLFKRMLDGHLKTHHGIFIDIIPLDYVPKNKRIRKREDLFRRILFTISLSKLKCRLTKHVTIAFFSKILSFFFSTKTLRHLIHKSMTKYQDTPTGLVACLMSAYPLEKQVFTEETFGTPAELEFEGQRFMVPADYKTVLKNIYGDYMTPPPISKRKTSHTITKYCINTQS
jgi:lipopolysaccharide cholinephosphotransferase